MSTNIGDAASQPIPQTPSPALATLRGDVVSGIAGVLFLTPSILGCGVIVFQPLGTTWLPAGIMAAFATAIVVAVLRGLIGGKPLHVNAPRPTQAAFLAALMVQVSAIPAFEQAAAANPDARAGLLVAVAALSLAVSGVAQVALGLARLGELVKFVPFPIVAGFFNGFIIQITVTQVPYLLGLKHWGEVRTVLTGAGGAVNLWALALGLLAGAIAWKTPRALHRVPAALVGLAAGTAAYHLAGRLLVDPAVLGPTLGALPDGLPITLRLADIGDLLGHPVFPDLAWPILAAGMTLAFVSSIQSLLSATVADALFKTRHDSNRELMVQGAGNVLSALCGGTASGGSPLHTRLIHANGGGTPLANLVLGLSLLAAIWGLNDAIGLIPLSVMAAAVIVTIVGTVDDWTRQLIHRLRTNANPATRPDLLANLAILLLVTGLVAFVDVRAALGLGMFVTVAIFLKRSGASVVRRIYGGDQVHSNTARPSATMRKLEQHGAAIAVIDMQGPVFFGSADRLAQRAEAVAAGADTLILDFRRVSDVDSTGALILKRLDDTLAQTGKTVLLAGLPDGSVLRQFVRDIGFDRPEAEGRVFADVNGALGRAEDALLTRLGDADAASEPEIRIQDHESLRGLGDGQIDILAVMLRRREFAPGERIIAEGDAGDTLYFLMKGQVSAQKRLPCAQRALRLGGIRAGTIFGEMALITGEVRTADIVADSPVVCYELTSADIATMGSIDPGIAFILLRTITAELTIRVKKLNHALWELER